MQFLAFFTGGIGRWLVLAAAVAIGLAVVRHHLIQEGRDEVLNEMARQEVRVRNLRDGITKQLEAKHAQDISGITARFDKFIAGLRHPTSPKPIPVIASVCSDVAGNSQLSGAISEYLDRGRQIRLAEREQVARLIEQAELNTKTLVDIEGWVTELGKVK